METETERERFVRLGTHRTNEVLRKLKVLGNCANRNLYEYDDKDIEKIFTEIERKMREVKAQFKTTKRSRDREFTL
jgi:hypothetical protein